jgi:tyrosinase
MVDYCWAKWNIELENDNTNDSGWNNTSWDHFVSGKGDPVSVTAGATTLMPLLSYQYESSAVGGFAAARELSARSAQELQKIETRVRQGAPVTFEVRKRVPIVKGTRLAVARPFSAQTQVAATDFAALIEADGRTEQVFASINTAKAPPVNDFFIRVFVNLPGANAQTPTDDVHYAGSFAFFGTDDHGHSHHGGKTDFLVNVTSTLRSLKRAGQLRTGEPLSVQLVTVPATGQFTRPDVELTVEGVDFIVSPVIVRAK